MFIRRSVFEKLVKRCESQHQEIQSLQEKLGILAQKVGHQFQFSIGDGWELVPMKPEDDQFVEGRREQASAAEFSW
jgi:hypothetical protein